MGLAMSGQAAGSSIGGGGGAAAAFLRGRRGSEEGQKVSSLLAVPDQSKRQWMDKI
jgi:hypothetical protein